LADYHTGWTLPEGSQVRSGAPAILPVKLLSALGVLFEDLGCVSEAYVVFVQFTRPDSSTDQPHLALQIRMRDDAPMRFSELLLRMEETVKKSYPHPERPIDILEIGKDPALKGPFSGAQLFCKFVDGKAVPL
jgi:hypothetical protein